MYQLNDENASRGASGGYQRAGDLEIETNAAGATRPGGRSGVRVEPRHKARAPMASDVHLRYCEVTTPP
jgi:hypothetical protein